jgi:RNA polymerase sigma-70 factor (family 1)
LSDTISLYKINEEEINKWLSQISNDDQEAFTRLLGLFWNKVYIQALTYLKSPFKAQELTQDVFVKLWVNRSKLPHVTNFLGYLSVMCRNEIFSMLRKKANVTVQPDETVQEEYWIPDKQLQKKHSYHAILKAIELLPPMRKNVFKMSRLDGLSYDEIAGQLNISRNGVKDHIVKALAFVRNYLRFQSDELLVILFCCFQALLHP